MKQKTRKKQNSLAKKFPITIELIRSRQAEGYIDVVVGILCFLLVIALAINLFPVFMKKQQLNTFATELVREAEMSGRTDLSECVERLKGQTGLNPQIIWDCDYYSGKKVQLNGDIMVILKDKTDIGFFSFGSFPIEITAKASGKSEIYYK